MIPLNTDVCVTISGDRMHYLFTEAKIADRASAEDAYFYSLSTEQFRRDPKRWINHMSEKNWFNARVCYALMSLYNETSAEALS